MRVHWKTSIVAALLLALASCAQPGIQSAATLGAQRAACNQAVVVTISSVTQARDVSTALRRAGKISVADLQNVVHQADTVRAGLDLARGWCESDPTGADAKIKASREMLRTLTTYLISREQAK